MGRRVRKGLPLEMTLEQSLQKHGRQVQEKKIWTKMLITVFPLREI